MTWRLNAVPVSPFNSFTLSQNTSKPAFFTGERVFFMPHSASGRIMPLLVLAGTFHGTCWHQQIRYQQKGKYGSHRHICKTFGGLIDTALSLSVLFGTDKNQRSWHRWPIQLVKGA
jgi:hypothetical protein